LHRHRTMIMEWRANKAAKKFANVSRTVERYDKIEIAGVSYLA